jgi:cobalt-zinc-cadmium efflux system protein
LAHHHHHHHAKPGTALRRLRLVLALTAAYFIAEVVGGWISNSLALLADAGHMLTDIMALSIALIAAWISRRPADSNRTYGYQRIEILAALFNGVAVIVIALVILYEAWERFMSPPEVDYKLMAIIAFGGLLVNLSAALILGGHQHGLNVRAAYLHVLGDLLGSIAALTGAGLIALFGWKWADPVASALIACIIVVAAVRLVLTSANVLMEGVPSHLSIKDVRESLLATPGVRNIHDLHLWSLAGERPLLSAHLVADGSLDVADILRAATRTLVQRFGITHATLQVEPPELETAQELTTIQDSIETEGS